MHIPRPFAQTDSAQLSKLIEQYPFATLISQSDTGLEAHHIPFILKRSGEKNILQAHIARANPLWQNRTDESNVLVVFSGPNCYVSPNYYPSKKDHGKAVPTWNYVTVHVQGTISFVHDEKWILQMIDQLTAQQEAAQPDPWSTSDAPEDYIQRMLSAVVGIKINVSSMTGSWKLSQNQSDKNILGVVDGLSKESESDSQKIAALVEAHSKKLS